jgi:hypothetical protein
MARTFENPANGHKEEVGIGASIGVLLFGALYLAVQGLWRHVFIWLAVVAVPSALGGGPALILFLPVACFAYAFTIQSILASDYLRKGWREVGPEAVGKPDLTTDRFMDPVEPSAPPNTKTCPFCAEEIKFEVIKCKHCQSDLSAVASSA